MCVTPQKKKFFDLEILFSIKKFCLGFLRRNTVEILNEKLHFLCNLCDKTNSKSKYRMKQKFSIVWSCCPNKFFMEIPASGFPSVILCSNLMMMHEKRGYNTLTQGITTVKIFIEYKKVLLLLNLPQNTRGAVPNVVITETIKKKQVKHNWTCANLLYLSAHKKLISSHTSFIRYCTFKNLTIWQFDWRKVLASTHPSITFNNFDEGRHSQFQMAHLFCMTELNKLAKFLRCELSEKYILSFSWRRSLSYRNQSTDSQSKSMDWFLYDRDLPHESVKVLEQLSYDVVSCAAVSVDT